MSRRIPWLALGLGALVLSVSMVPQPAESPPAPPSEPSPAFAGLAPPFDLEPVAASSTNPTVAEPAREAVDPAYRGGERLVRFADGSDPAAVAADHGVTLATAPGRSGYALVVGERVDLGSLMDDPRVVRSMPHAVTHGAGNMRTFQGGLEHLQWYIDAVDPPLDGLSEGWGSWSSTYPVSDYVVAVLDTGVAYETAVRDGVSYVAAPSLSSSAIVAPYDFVNDDPHANDDHQHGTHIATLIAADGISSQIEGVSPGVGIMPIKVLDEHNTGTEIDLIEGVWHAVDHGADVINMSLSFGEGYRPSAALLDALQAAHDAGIVMVGASGNEGADYTTWPAASPLVIAVGSATLASHGGSYEGLVPAGYSNTSAGVDLMVTGGDIYQDHFYSGLPDGILAETIAPGTPGQVGYWLMAGTSQAAAIVSGMAVEMMRGTVPAEEVYTTLQLHSRHHQLDRTSSMLNGEGAGYLDMAWGSELNANHDYDRAKDFHVAMMPFLARVGFTHVQPSARVTVFEGAGTLAVGVRVVASLYGSQSGLVSCLTDSHGTCDLHADVLPEHDGAGNPLPHAVAFSVEKVVDHHSIGHHPQIAMTASGALQDVVGALDADPAYEDALLTWYWDEGVDADLGPTALSLTVVDSGSGLASIPLGLVISPSLVGQLGPISADSLSTGAGDVPFVVIDVEGSGLASIPLGLRDMRLVSFAGSGLVSIPLGVRAKDMLGGGPTFVPLGGSGLVSIPLGLRGTPLGDRLLDGGWQVEGYGAASALGSSAQLAVSPGFVVGLDGSGMGTAALPWSMQP